MVQGHVDPSTLEGGLHADGSGAVLACCAIFIVFCTLAVLLRLYALRVSRRPVFLEDHLMAPTWVMMMGLCANGIWSVTAGGVGRHEAWVAEHSPKSLQHWAQSLFITEFVYGLLIPTEKTSILLLYLRLFGIRRWFRYTTYALIAYIWMWGVSESIVAVAQCRPVAYQWDKALGGKCINQLDYFRWICLPNAIHDVAMLVAPIRVVSQLQVPRRQKVALMGVFLIGSIGCVASFIRTYYFFQLDAFSDRTWSSIQLMSWTIAEPGVILICACMPSLWPILRRLPGFRTLSNNKSDPSRRRQTRSSQRGLESSNWTSRSRGQHDTFVPLDDTDDQTVGYEIDSFTNSCDGMPGASQSRVDGLGISVTKEVPIIRQQ